MLLKAFGEREREKKNERKRQGGEEGREVKRKRGQKRRKGKIKACSFPGHCVPSWRWHRAVAPSAGKKQTSACTACVHKQCFPGTYLCAGQHLVRACNDRAEPGRVPCPTLLSSERPAAKKKT